MFSGFGTPEDTNRRFRYLLAHGQTGLSTAFDMPTLMGFDPDDPLARGEVGREGVSVASVADIERLFADIPLDRGDDVDDHQRAGGGAAGVLRRRRRAARHRRPRRCAAPSRTTCSRSSSRRRNGSAASGPRLRIIRDMLVTLHGAHAAAGTRSASAATTSARRARPRCRSWRSRSPTASATSSWAATPGLDVDAFAPRLSFFWDVHNDFFEEIAKLRAARRMWARHHARPLRRQEPALLDAARARADRGRVAGGAAAAQQRGAHDAAGAGGGAGRHAVAAHQQLRRDATRCRPRRRRRWRCARSRSSPRSRASRRSPIRSAAATTSSR